jgi:ATP-binding cassette subfamily B protein
VPLDSIRQAIVLLDQPPYLFQVSVRENIAQARPDASYEEISTGCRAAFTSGFLRFPSATKQAIAERGQSLSAGERQRIALARALLADPKVLVPD